MASDNKHDNIVEVTDWNSLSTVAQVDTLIEDVCAQGVCELKSDVCQSWCSAIGTPWGDKCTWTNTCAGCSECDSTCMNFCEDHTASWDTKCTWSCCKDTCSECA